ncbi:MAG: protein O-GlcNAcase [Deltaproteobacteria bacterium]|nr:protein O-GlcNAcase [Deltaproteobacteria bacterium]
MISSHNSKHLLSLFLATFIALSCSARVEDIQGMISENDISNSIDDAGPGDLKHSDLYTTPDTHYPTYEIIRDIRISASNTKTWGGFGWVREAEDSIFTIRDDVPETCYKGPENQEVTLTFDIYTIFKSSPLIKEFHLNHNQNNNIIFKVSASPNCYEQPVVIYETNFEKPLSWEDARFGCITVNFTSVKGLEICSGSLKSQLKIWRSLDFKPQKTDKNFGIIEGFYGVRWSYTEREKIILTLSKYGLGMYIYAPKDDPKHRERWREDYSNYEMQVFSEIASIAEKSGVDFYYAISPFIDFDYENSKDFETLFAKLKRFTGYGIKNFAIFADDIEMEKDIKVNSELGRIHTDITNNIYKSLKNELNDVKMLFVGTVYSDERTKSFEDGYGYLREIAKLDTDIKIFWTGLKTSGATLTGEDIKLFTEITGRKPLIWDNFWANDGGDGFMASLYLSDYTGRDKTILDKIEGIAINPLIQGSLTLLNLMRFGEWKNGDLSKDWARNALYWFEVFDRYNPPPQSKIVTDYVIENLILLTEIYNGNSNKKIEFTRLNIALDELYSSLASGDKESVITSIINLLRIFAQMYVIQSVLYNSSIDTEMFDEIFFPSEKVRLDAQAGMYGIQFLLSKLNNEPDYEKERKMKYYLEKSSNQRFIYSAGEMNRFADYISHTNFEKKYDIKILEPNERIPSDCGAKLEKSFKPFKTNTEIEIFGLPKNYYKIEEDAVKIKIPYAGNYDIVILNHSKDGVNVIFQNIVCK